VISTCLLKFFPFDVRWVTITGERCGFVCLTAAAGGLNLNNELSSGPPVLVSRCHTSRSCFKTRHGAPTCIPVCLGHLLPVFLGQSCQCDCPANLSISRPQAAPRPIRQFPKFSLAPSILCLSHSYGVRATQAGMHWAHRQETLANADVAAVSNCIAILQAHRSHC
jgi:hypothetical protein